MTQTELRLVFQGPTAASFISLVQRHPSPAMEFAQEGGEGATPYEMLLQAALAGDSTHFTRQDSVEEADRPAAAGLSPARARV